MRMALGMRFECCAAAWIGLTVLSPVLVAQQRDLRLTPDPSRRLALVFGNDDYQHAPKLHNAANDADDLARMLAELGFEVDRVTNAGLRGMETAINRFVAKLRAGDVAFFHFSGHGIQIEGQNYLIPVDFQLSDEASVKYDAYSASKLHDRLAGSGSRLNIVVLDACRNNGFRTTRSAGAGLAAMHAAEGSFVAFSTSPGMTADDNPTGDNGLFTSYLLEALQQPGLDLDRVFNDVREKVYQASGKRQLPWSSSSVIGQFHFRPEMAEAPPQPSIEASLAVELTYWNSIKDSSNPALFEAYLTEHPEGSFATLAKIKLEELKGRASSAPGPAASVEEPVAVEPAPPIATARVRPGRVPEASAPPIVEPPEMP
ncbi:MAG: caspase family protein, partial [bacterium]|nr:caspase family protein [bacterium]